VKIFAMRPVVSPRNSIRREVMQALRPRVRGFGALSLICVLGGAAEVGCSASGGSSGGGGGAAAAVDVMLLPTPRQPGLLASRPRPAFSVKRTPMVAVQRMSGGGDDLVTCRIEVQVQHTRPGDAVMLLGSNPVLHSWNKQEAIELTTSEADFPWWSAEVQLPAGEELEYKFAIRRYVPPTARRMHTHRPRRSLQHTHEGVGR
jgi:hypothetical protein